MFGTRLTRRAAAGTAVVAVALIGIAATSALASGGLAAGSPLPTTTTSSTDVTFDTTTTSATTAPGTTPTISIADASTPEGNTGTRLLRFVVSLSETTTHNVVFHAAITGGTATANDDYVSLPSNAYAIPAGETSTNIDVVVNGDTFNEPLTETVLMSLGGTVVGGVLGDFQAVGSIFDDDDTIEAHKIYVSDLTVTEGDRAIFTILLGSPAEQKMRLQIATQDGTALRKLDYAGKSDTITIAAGKSSATVKVKVKKDRLTEGSENFYLIVSGQPAGWAVYGPGRATITP